MKRIYILAVMLEEFTSADIQQLFKARIKNRESFAQVCEHLILPYGAAAKVVGWDFQTKRFVEPVRTDHPFDVRDFVSNVRVGDRVVRSIPAWLLEPAGVAI